MKTVFRGLGFAVSDSPAPICSVTFLDEAKNKALHNILLERGIYPPFINYPGRPPGGHFRFTPSSEHTEEQVETLLQAVRDAVTLNR